MIDLSTLESDYPVIKSRYNRLGETLKPVLSNLLGELQVHGINYRVKDLKSLSNKIELKNKYERLEDITDLCGIRVITFLDSEVNKAAQIIRDNLTIDESNSTDRNQREPNQFGYRSSHLIVSLDPIRSSLPEFVNLGGLKAEIQIRSILQHAWAEIEHDLGYKSGDEVPYEFSRRFNRLSAVLESADFEFNSLKALKVTYKKEVSKSQSNVITLPLDVISLSIMIDNNKALAKVRSYLIKRYQISFTKKSSNLSQILKQLQFFEIITVEKLEARINGNATILIAFVKLLFERRSDRGQLHLKLLRREAPLEYFLHLLGSARDEQYWEAYRGMKSKTSITEVTDFLRLHKDALGEDEHLF